MKNMFKNPYLNAIYAEVYILIIVTVMHYFSPPNTPDTFFDPVVALSLLVLSASVMGYLFLGEPIQLYLGGEKGRSISFFMKTVMSFAVLTILAVAMLELSR